MTLRTCTLALLLASPGPVLAELSAEDPADDLADPAPEHGKAATADASPVDVRSLEAEIGYAPIWNDPGGALGFDTADAGYTHGVAGTLTYGVLPDLDVKLSAGFGTTYDAAHHHPDGSTPTHGSGVTDTTLGARWRFLNVPERALELAVTGDLVLPVGSPHTPTAIGLTQGFWTGRLALVATKDFGALTSNAELAVTAPLGGDAGGLRSIAQANAAVGYQLTPWLQPEVELNYSRAAGLGPDAHVLAVTAGVVAPFGGGNRIVAAVQHGLWGQNAIQTTAAVLSFKTALRIGR